MLKNVLLLVFGIDCRMQTGGDASEAAPVHPARYLTYLKISFNVLYLPPAFVTAITLSPLLIQLLPSGMQVELPQIIRTAQKQP